MKKLLFILSSLLFLNQAHADFDPYGGFWSRCDGLIVIDCRGCTDMGCKTIKVCTWVGGVPAGCTCGGKECDD